MSYMGYGDGCQRTAEEEKWDSCKPTTHPQALWPLPWSICPFPWTRFSSFSWSFHQTHALGRLDGDPEKGGYCHLVTGCAGGTVRQEVTGAFKWCPEKPRTE